VPTGHTPELKTSTVLLSNMATSRASLRCIGRIHDLRSYTFLCQLVAGLELKIGIGPSTDFLSKVLALFQGCLSNVAKVFEHDYSSTYRDGVLSQGLRGNMEEMFRNGPFAVSQALEEALGRPGTYGLNLSPSLSDTLTSMVQLSSTEEKRFSIGGVGGNEHTFDAGVDTNDTAPLGRIRDIDLIAKDQVETSTNRLEFRVFPASKRYVPVIKGNRFSPESYATGGFVEVSFPDNRYGSAAQTDKFPFLLGSKSPVKVRDPLTKATRELRGKPEFLPEGRVIRSCKSIGVQFFGFKNNLTKPVSCTKIICNYLVRLVGPFDFDSGCSDSFHYVPTTVCT